MTLYASTASVEFYITGSLFEHDYYKGHQHVPSTLCMIEYPGSQGRGVKQEDTPQPTQIKALAG